MSQHVAVGDNGKSWMYGWDQMLQSFFLQVRDDKLPEDDRVIARYGASPDTVMYEVDDLVRVARKHGLDIPYETRVELYGEKDDGR